MKPRVLVTRHVYPAAIPILQEHCVVDYKDSYDVLSEDELSRHLQHRLEDARLSGTRASDFPEPTTAPRAYPRQRRIRRQLPCRNTNF
jgi:hypothetical protein